MEFSCAIAVPVTARERVCVCVCGWVGGCEDTERDSLATAREWEREREREREGGRENSKREVSLSVIASHVIARERVWVSVCVCERCMFVRDRARERKTLECLCMCVCVKALTAHRSPLTLKALTAHP